MRNRQQKKVKLDQLGERLQIVIEQQQQIRDQADMGQWKSNQRPQQMFQSAPSRETLKGIQRFII